MASPQEIKKYWARLETEYRDRKAEVDQKLLQQWKEEAEIIRTTQSFCPLSNLEDRIATVENIKEALQSDDAEVLHVILCMNNLIATLPPRSGRSTAIRHYLHNLHQIGGESADGYAMLVDVNEITTGKDLFVLKSPKRSEFSQELLHEYFVGAFGTNMLRSYMPTFTYIFGTFQCSLPYIDSTEYLGDTVPTSKANRYALTYCQNNRFPVNYVLYEKVSGISLGEFVRTCTIEEFLSILIQIIFAIQTAYDLFQFSHNDLHTENVLVVTLEQPISIVLRYPDGRQQYLQTRVVAKIIDYGRSHIVYQGRHYGSEVIMQGIYPDRPFPLNDIYKLLMFSLLDMSIGYNLNYNNYPDNAVKLINPTLYKQAKVLINYFWTPSPGELELYMACPANKDLTSYLSQIRETYYILPDTFIKAMPLDFYLKGVLPCFETIINRMVTPIPQAYVFGCYYNNTCQSPEQAFLNYTIPVGVNLQDPYIFFDTLNQPNINKTKLIEEGYPYVEYQMNRLLNDVYESWGWFTKAYFSIQYLKLSSEVISNQALLDRYRRFVDRTVISVDILTTIYEIINILKTLSQAYGISIEIPEIDPNIRSEMDSFISSIQNDALEVQKLVSDKDIKEKPSNSWLLLNLPILITALQNM